jgi:hypothetical protein
MLLLPATFFFLSILQLVNDVRQQLQEGAGQAAAVEHVARKRLTGLVGAKVSCVHDAWTVCCFKLFRTGGG